MKIRLEDLYPADIARMSAVRSHGFTAALWRWGKGTGPYSLVDVVRCPNEFTVRHGKQLASECLFRPIDALLKEVGIKEQS
jgi:hypothetical protein